MRSSRSNIHSSRSPLLIALCRRDAPAATPTESPAASDDQTGSVSEKREHAPSRPASPANNSAKLTITARVARLPRVRSPLLGRTPGMAPIPRRDLMQSRARAFAAAIVLLFAASGKPHPRLDAAEQQRRVPDPTAEHVKSFKPVTDDMLLHP